MANYVHKNNAQPASVEIKNGLSAYELAVEQGYKGGLDEWLQSLDGKSAYEIAVDNGYSGTEDEWNKALTNITKQNITTIKNAEFSKDGDLIITVSDGTTIDVGKVAGSDGKTEQMVKTELTEKTERMAQTAKMGEMAEVLHRQMLIPMVSLYCRFLMALQSILIKSLEQTALMVWV